MQFTTTTTEAKAAEAIRTGRVAGAGFVQITVYYADAKPRAVQFGGSYWPRDGDMASIEAICIRHMEEIQAEIAQLKTLPPNAVDMQALAASSLGFGGAQ